MLLQSTGWKYGQGIGRDLTAYRAVAALLGEESSSITMPDVIQKLDKGIDNNLADQLRSYAADVVLEGFPVESGEGSAFVNLISLGMCTASENKDGVWDFYKYMLSDAAQQSRGEFQENTIPVKKSVWEQYFEQQMNPQNISVYWIGSIVENEEYEALVPPLSEKAVDDVTSLVEQMTYIDEIDHEIFTILVEESEKYYQGQISREQAAQTIISRIMIYQSEQKI